MHFLPDFDAIVDALGDELRPGDVLLTQGAGSVTTVGPRVLDNMERKENKEHTAA